MVKIETTLKTDNIFCNQAGQLKHQSAKLLYSMCNLYLIIINMNIYVLILYIYLNLTTRLSISQTFIPLKL